jgi:uncharacterized membrane protein YeaQ/YmgE (transglycosylase-associated protein family)
MDVLAFILIVALQGLIIGGLARLLLPGKDPMSLLATMAIGIAGSFIGGGFAYYAFGNSAGIGLIAAVISAMGFVYAVRTLRHRREDERPLS